jgi:hypothetical protein
MTKQEREIIRLMYQLRVEEGRYQTRLLESLRDAIESTQKMQAAQNQMLEAIAELLKLQEDRDD